MGREKCCGRYEKGESSVLSLLDVVLWIVDDHDSLQTWIILSQKKIILFLL